MLFIARIAKEYRSMAEPISRDKHWIIRQRNVFIRGAQGVFRELSVRYLDERFDS